MTWNLSRLLSTSNFLYLWLLREIFSLLKSFNSLGFLFPPNSTRIDRNSSVYYRDWRFMSTFKIGPLDNRSLLGLGHNIIIGHLVWSWVGAWQFEDPDIINARKSDMKFSLEQLNWPHYYPLKVQVTFLSHFYHSYLESKIYSFSILLFCQVIFALILIYPFIHRYP